MSKNIEDEILRLKSTLKNLEGRTEPPSPEMAELITYYQHKLKAARLDMLPLDLQEHLDYEAIGSGDHEDDL
ncbi:hypothetical protein [Rhizobium mongolense]|uniref:Uncharacterized protein n=2 Tax=Rhizobium mongolense TaxID=57676 RepID=A0ABR6IQA1_9HYPH|nr:hypothetical protein [Rhizobium mongolense]MBB4230061.1 hypothetical protein [Rhizobium mongolense]TVZ72808.1 hypothetical protein BCL32_0995 [Rhizobium mongolense USDA 1844]